MDKCFVIQPFDNDVFDKRYNDIFEPAIRKAGLEPYRIDKDLSVRIPIEEIERGILESTICFAEITTNNPNVWYELGYSFACSKDVIMVCSNERDGKFPFDIQHRHVISYKTGSKSDFESLEDTITKKINAFRDKSAIISSLQVEPVLATEGLKSHEVALIILIAENQILAEDSVSIRKLTESMGKSGFTEIAISLAIRVLSRQGLIETFLEYDEWNNGNSYRACRLTESGESWLISNQGQFQYRKPPPGVKTHPEDEDLPF